MTTDKPGAVATKAGAEIGDVCDGHWGGDEIEQAAAIIQTAIDEATAAVEAERDQLVESWNIVEKSDLTALQVAQYFINGEATNDTLKTDANRGGFLQGRLASVIDRARLDGAVRFRQERDEAQPAARELLDIARPYMEAPTFDAEGGHRGFQCELCGSTSDGDIKHGEVCPLGMWLEQRAALLAEPEDER